MNLPKSNVSPVDPARPVERIPDPMPITTGLDFQGPDLAPAPVPELAQPELNVWAFLEYVDPIEHPEMLAFQVAQLTVGMGELLRMVADLAAQVDELNAMHPVSRNMKGRTDERGQ